MGAPFSIGALAFGQAFGSTEKYMCPKCLGGGKEEISLSLTVDDMGRIHWLCHRASCGYKGGPRGVRPLHAPKPLPVFRNYTRPLKTLTPDQQEILRSKYGMYCPDVTYNEDTDRFLLPIQGPRLGQERGYIARSLSGEEPKTITYKTGEPFVHWAYPRDVARRFISIVVEDFFSAEKVAKAGFTGISINGTHLNQFCVDEILENSTGTVILALDGDAYAKALSLQQRYREQFPRGLLVMRLTQDLKYLTTEEINEMVDEVMNAGRNNNKRTPEEQGSV